MSLVAAVASILLTVAGSSAGLWAFLVDASELSKKRYFDEIPGRAGERVLFSAQGWPVEGLALVVDLPVADVTAALAVGSRWLGQFEVERTESATIQWPARGYTKSSEEGLRQESERFRQAGINVDHVPEWRATFRPYNEHAATQEHSTLTLRVVDAQSVFGANCTLVRIERVDRTYVHLRTFHLGIPLPMRRHSEIQVVTDTELKLLGELETRLGNKVLGTIGVMGRGPIAYHDFPTMSSLAAIVNQCAQGK